MAGKDRKKKKRPPEEGSAEQVDQQRPSELDDRENAGTRTDPAKQKAFFTFSGELTDPTETEVFGVEETRTEPEGPEIEAPQETAKEERLELEESLKLEDQPEVIAEDSATVELEDETHTDALRAEELIAPESVAAQEQQPVETPTATPGPAPTGTQPSSIFADQEEATDTDVGAFDDREEAPAAEEPAIEVPEEQELTYTEMFKPEELTGELPETVAEPLESITRGFEETQSEDFDLDTTRKARAKPQEQFVGPDTSESFETGDETRTEFHIHDAPEEEEVAEEPELVESATDFHDADTADFEEPAEVDFHEADTGDIEEPAPEPVQLTPPAHIEVEAPEELEAEPVAAAPRPTRREPKTGTLLGSATRKVFGAVFKRRTAKEVDTRPLRTRLKEFFSPRTFFKEAKRELKAVASAWVQSGHRAQADIRVEKTAAWWRRTVIETAALFAIIVPIEMVVHSGAVGSFGVHPHPYWLVVLPMAGARGVVAGLLSAITASVLYAIGALQALGLANLSELFEFRNMTEPILFLGVGFFAGELHDELALRYRKLSRQLKDVQDRVKSLRQERDVLGDANKLLERRIVDQSVQFGNMVVAAKRIESAGRREIFDIALDMVEEHCGASASVLLVLADGSIDFVCHVGWRAEELSDRLAAARESDFVQRALAEGVNVNGFSTDEEAPEEGPVVVSPLFDGSGVVKALLCMDDLPATRLNESTITIFFGISEWLSAALARVARAPEEAAISQPTIAAAPLSEIWLGTPNDLGERLRLELERCSRYGVATSFLAIQATEFADTSREGSDMMDRFACLHFTGNMRPSDALYRFGYPGCYLLVLAGTAVEGAEVVRQRLLRRVDYSPSKGVGPIEIFAAGPDAETPDLLSLVDKIAGRFREASPLALGGSCPVEVAQEPKAGAVDAFIRRLRMETSLAVRNGFALHLVGITADTPGDVDAMLLARHVHEAGLRTLRPTDGVYALGPHQAVIILPCTAEEEAAMVSHRLVQAVRARDPDAAYGSVETQVLGLGDPHPDVASFLEALGRYGRGGSR